MQELREHSEMFETGGGPLYKDLRGEDCIRVSGSERLASVSQTAHFVESETEI